LPYFKYQENNIFGLIFKTVSKQVMYILHNINPICKDVNIKP